ncbi:MAG: peptide ABC transporter substrate-binding protein [Anaerolineae bacterium]
MKSRVSQALGLLVLLSLLLSGGIAACVPAATPSAGVAEEPTAPPPTETPPPTAVIDTSGGEVQRGGTVVFLIPEEPANLNHYLADAAIVRQVADAVVDGLVEINLDGEYVPELAAELPTLQNGGVSEDFLTVTWKLKPGLQWSDGQPITSDDIKFTWEAVSHPESGAVQTGGFDLIESVETPDELTAVVHYKELYVAYLGQFRWGIFPRHAAGEPADMLNWEWNRNPVGAGPFMVSEWAAGDHITLVPNPHYREEGKPYLDRLIFRVVPAYDAQLAMMKQGDAHVQLWPGEAKRVWDQMMGGIAEQQLVPGIWNMAMDFNLSKPFDGDPGPEPPHPSLGDLRVRQAIAYGIDYDYIIQDVMEGDVSPSYSPFEYGWYKCKMERPYPYDPDKAMVLLDEAGWKDEDGDGIRECHGCPYGEEGEPLRLQLMGYTNFPPLDRTEEAIVEQMKAIGIEMYIQNEDFSVIFGGWSDRAPRKTGDFDIMIYDRGFDQDPHTYVATHWASDQIPSAENPDGANWYRWQNEKADEAIQRAGSSPDLDVRRAAYCDLAEEMNKDAIGVYIYLFKDGYGFNKKVHGYTVSTWGSMSWDVANWWIEQ